jgi:hypothetical protein
MKVTIPSLVDTWTSHFGLVPIEDGDQEMLSNLSLIYIYIYQELCS